MKEIWSIIPTSLMIAADHPRDDVRCSMGVLDTWLPDASWNQLISVLRSPTVQLDSLADQLEQMLNTECKIYSNSVTTHYCNCILHHECTIVASQIMIVDWLYYYHG